LAEIVQVVFDIPDFIGRDSERRTYAESAGRFFGRRGHNRKAENLNGAFMNIPEEIDRIKSAIKTVEDPGAATALRHVCKALAEISDQLEAEEKKKRRENEGIEVQ